MRGWLRRVFLHPEGAYSHWQGRDIDGEVNFFNVWAATVCAVVPLIVVLGCLGVLH